MLGIKDTQTGQLVAPIHGPPVLLGHLYGPYGQGVTRGVACPLGETAPPDIADRDQQAVAATRFVVDSINQ